MRHLRSIFESDNQKERDYIDDNLLGISDIFGEPEITVRDYPSGVRRYSYIWPIFKYPGNRTTSVQYFNIESRKLWEIQDTLLSAERRLSKDFDFIVNLICTANQEKFLTISLDPKISTQYEFINRFDGSTLYLNDSAIEDFFAPDDRYKNKKLVTLSNYGDKKVYLLLGRYGVGYTGPNFKHKRDKYEEFVMLLLKEQEAKKIEPIFDISYKYDGGGLGDMVIFKNPELDDVYVGLVRNY